MEIINSNGIWSPFYDAASDYCSRVFKDKTDARLPYHNLQHTRQVVDHVHTIGKHMSVTTEALEPVSIAAWFHDLGFSKVYQGHEDQSIALAKSFLSSINYPKENLATVVDCIEGTKMPQNPSCWQAEILCDADVFHLGSIQFTERSNLLRKEWQMALSQVYSDKEWYALNLEFLEAQCFFTPYGKSILKEGKADNVLLLQQKVLSC